MEENTNYNSVIQLWKGLGKEINHGEVLQQLEVYKKLLRFFQVGNFYYVILNLTSATFELVSPTINSVLGYDAEEIDIQFWIGLIHPEDQTWFANFEHETAKFLYALPHEKLFDYKVQYDLRFKKKDGTYCRILHQALTIEQYPEGGIYRTIGVETDISHIKLYGKPSLSFIGLNGEPSYIDVKIGEPLVPFKDVLSKREKEVLQLIIEGKANKEIAELLNISKLTVDKHRKNMILRNGFKNSSELIAESIKQGWIV